MKAGVATSCALQEMGVLLARAAPSASRGLVSLLGVERSQSLLLGAVPLIELGLPFAVEQAADHADDP